MKWQTHSLVKTIAKRKLNDYRKVTIGTGKTKLPIRANLTIQGLPTGVVLIHCVQQLLHLRHRLIREEATLLTNDCLGAVFDQRPGITPRTREGSNVLGETSIVVRSVLHLLLVVTHCESRENGEETHFGVLIIVFFFDVIYDLTVFGVREG